MVTEDIIGNPMFYIQSVPQEKKSNNFSGDRKDEMVLTIIQVPDELV